MAKGLLFVVFMLASGGLMAGLGRAYYRRQNERAVLGGAISKPKAVWLFFALYQYFGVSAAAWLYLPAGNRFYGALSLFVGLMYLRLAAQGALMFWIKKWTPPMGIAHNLLSSALVGGAWALAAGSPGAWDADELAAAAWLAMAVLMLLADTYYAAAFYRLVGRGNTTGEAAIWYASAGDLRFEGINRLTRVGNAFFIAYFVAVCLAYAIKG